MCKMHKLTLEDFNYDVHKMVDAVFENKAILTSCEETDNSIVSNLFRILGEAPCAEFKSWVLTNQNVYDNGGVFDLDNFLVSCQNKYTNFVADGLWKTRQKTKKDLEKETEIVALNSRFDNLEKLLLAQTNNKSQERNGKTWSWCKHHGYWTTGHTSDNCRKGLATTTSSSGQPNGGTNPSLALNMAEIEDNDFSLADTNLNFNDAYDNELDSLVMKQPKICMPCSENHENNKPFTH